VLVLLGSLLISEVEEEEDDEEEEEEEDDDDEDDDGAAAAAKAKAKAKKSGVLVSVPDTLGLVRAMLRCSQGVLERPVFL